MDLPTTATCGQIRVSDKQRPPKLPRPMLSTSKLMIFRRKVAFSISNVLPMLLVIHCDSTNSLFKVISRDKMYDSKQSKHWSLTDAGTPG